MVIECGCLVSYEFLSPIISVGDFYDRPEGFWNEAILKDIDNVCLHIVRSIREEQP